MPIQCVDTYNSIAITHRYENLVVIQKMLVTLTGHVLNPIAGYIIINSLIDSLIFVVCRLFEFGDVNVVFSPFFCRVYGLLL